MLATKISELFNDDAWLYEIKWDGYRIIAHVQRGNPIIHLWLTKKIIVIYQRPLTIRRFFIDSNDSSYAIANHTFVT